jgi:hypothetical protein
LISTHAESKLPKKDVPLLQIPGLCTGGLTGSPGDISTKHCNQNGRGTAHIHIKALSPWEDKG